MERRWGLSSSAQWYAPTLPLKTNLCLIDVWMTTWLALSGSSPVESPHSSSAGDIVIWPLAECWCMLSKPYSSGSRLRPQGIDWFLVTHACSELLLHSWISLCLSIMDFWFKTWMRASLNNLCINSHNRSTAFPVHFGFPCHNIWPSYTGKANPSPRSPLLCWCLNTWKLQLSQGDQRFSITPGHPSHN